MKKNQLPKSTVKLFPYLAFIAVQLWLTSCNRPARWQSPLGLVLKSRRDEMKKILSWSFETHCMLWRQLNSCHSSSSWPAGMSRRYPASGTPGATSINVPAGMNMLALFQSDWIINKILLSKHLCLHAEVICKWKNLISVWLEFLIPKPIPDPAPSSG